MRKAALGFVFLIIVLNAADAQQRIVVSLHWITDSNGCKIWNSKPGPSESVTWSGPCKDGFADGKGELVWYVNGRRHGTYEGELRGGHYEGRGTQVWSNGARYEGEWQDDRAQGHGVYRAASGEVCSGTWVNGCFKGGKCDYSVGAPHCPSP